MRGERDSLVITPCDECFKHNYYLKKNYFKLGICNN